MSDYYEISGVPSTKSFGSSAAIRGEFQLIGQAFEKLPALDGAAGYFIRVNDSGTGMESLDGDDYREALGLIIGETVQAFTEVLQATTASFTTELKDKLDGFTLGETVQAYSEVLANTTASFTTELATKLNGMTIGETVQAFSTVLQATTASFTTDLKTKLEAMVNGGEFSIPVSEEEPDTPASGGVMFVKLFEGNPELFYKDAAGNVLRLTYKGETAVEFSSSDGVFDSFRTLSFLRGNVIDVPIVDGEAIIDWSLATVYRLTVDEEVSIIFQNMPNTAANEEQTIYIDVINGGAFPITLESAYSFDFPGGLNLPLQESGRDYFVATTNNGTTITVVPLLDLKGTP